MRAQLRDAAVSVPNNFAEGFKRRAANDKQRFYNISQASLEESRNLLMIANDVGYGNAVRLLRDAEEIARMLHGYMAGMTRRRRAAKGYTRRVPGSPY